MNTLALHRYTLEQPYRTLLSGLPVLAGCCILLLGLLFSPASKAGQFGVQVLDDRGRPVAGASVCLGLPGNYAQFAAMFTGSDGVASADVPNVPLIVTVSKTRFSAVRLSEPARRFNIFRKVILADGGTPGPRCRAGSTLADSDNSIVRVRNVAVHDSSSGRKVLTPDAVGKPTEYRVSGTERFTDIPWATLRGSITLPSRLVENQQVYLQLRRYQGSFLSWVEARSEPYTVYLQ
ncbi:MAG: hypothetical protein AB8B63_18435 [Granulosicoccus sp.]